MTWHVNSDRNSRKFIYRCHKFRKFSKFPNIHAQGDMWSKWCWPWPILKFIHIEQRIWDDSILPGFKRLHVHACIESYFFKFKSLKLSKRMNIRPCDSIDITQPASAGCQTGPRTHTKCRKHGISTSQRLWLACNHF